MSTTMQAGASDVSRAVVDLERRLPEPLRLLARVAYNYSWSWTPDGPDVFRDLDPYRWELFDGNPVHLLLDASPKTLEQAAKNGAFVARVAQLAARVDALLADDRASPASKAIAYFCAEFAIHGSLQIYAGGLGVLAGDFVKEASDRRLPLVGIGLFYRQGYFRQRVDLSGWQHEYWVDQDPERLPATLVTRDDGTPLELSVPIAGHDVHAHVWRVDVGRSALFLLDTALGENHPIDRWTTARLYEGSRRIRLAQYALLGIGGVRALEALGIEPAVVHLNEGHAAFAALELATREVARGADFQTACARVRERVVFTTHTPVAAGNETYSAEEIRAVFADLPGRLGTEIDTLLALGRRVPSLSEPCGITPIAIRMSRNVNGVSRRHGEVARAMWHAMYPRASVEQVPIGHVTNGVHLPTWMCPALSRLLDRYLPPGWREAAADPKTWDAVESIPDGELWQARMEARGHLVEFVRTRTIEDRLRRGEPMEYVEAAARTFNEDVLIVGFARRLATYKRLHLLTRDPVRALALLDGPRPLQLLMAGKAHPNDDGAKQIVRNLFGLKYSPQVGGRVAYLENQDMAVEAVLVCGCDVWVNLPRPPQEASGTSGMKAALNGVLNLSVLDGWWAEAYDGHNGWAIDGSVEADEEAKDRKDATALYDLLEHQVVPLFYEREGGIPHAWVRRIKTALRSLAPRYCASRMLGDYERSVYALGAAGGR